MPEILFRSARFIAASKPSGMLVHPMGEATDRVTMLSLLRGEVGGFVYPVHRLDRGTSGVLLMGLDRTAAAELSAIFRQRSLSKEYVALVRGWITEAMRIDRALSNPDRGSQEAVTDIEPLLQVAIPHAVGPYPEARYTLVRALPLTGRRHQIRRHLAGISHPVIGDTTHGDGDHNRLFRKILGSHRLLLHATALEFEMEIEGLPQRLESPMTSDFRSVCDQLGLKGDRLGG